jgi:hypothetical protein
LGPRRCAFRAFLVRSNETSHSSSLSKPAGTHAGRRRAAGDHLLRGFLVFIVFVALFRPYEYHDRFANPDRTRGSRERGKLGDATIETHRRALFAEFGGCGAGVRRRRLTGRRRNRRSPRRARRPSSGPARVDDVTPAGSRKGWRISLGSIAGLLLGFFCYLPVVAALRGCNAVVYLVRV